MTHETMVLIAKTFGLLWMVGFFIIVVVVTFRPSRKAAYDRAARSILRGGEAVERRR